MKWVWVMSQYFQSFKIPVKVTEICYTTRRKLKREKQINCREWGPKMMDLFISLKGAKWFINFHMWVDEDLSWGGSNEEGDADMGDWGREHLWTQQIDVRVEAEGRVTKPSSLLDRGMDCLALQIEEFQNCFQSTSGIFISCSGLIYFWLKMACLKPKVAGGREWEARYSDTWPCRWPISPHHRSEHELYHCGWKGSWQQLLWTFKKISQVVCHFLVAYLVPYKI